MFKNMTKYSSVKKPNCKRTLVNTIYYGVKLYQVNTNILNCTHVQLELFKNAHGRNIFISQMNVTLI